MKGMSRIAWIPSPVPTARAVATDMPFVPTEVPSPAPTLTTPASHAHADGHSHAHADGHSHSYVYDHPHHTHG